TGPSPTPPAVAVRRPAPRERFAGGSSTGSSFPFPPDSPRSARPLHQEKPASSHFSPKGRAVRANRMNRPQSATPRARGVSMTSAFWQAVRDGWQSLARQLWPATPEQEARDALAHLDAELARRYRRLVRRQLRIEQLRDRLAQHERRAAEVALRLAGVLLSGDRP